MAWKNNKRVTCLSFQWPRLGWKCKRRQAGRQLTSVLERRPGTEHTQSKAGTHTHTHTPKHILTPTHQQPPRITKHWSILSNPQPAGGAALNIQTNCPSSSAGCRRRHISAADRLAGPRGWLWRLVLASVQSPDALCLSTCITLLLATLCESDLSGSGGTAEPVSETDEHPGCFLYHLYPYSSQLFMNSSFMEAAVQMEVFTVFSRTGGLTSLRVTLEPKCLTATG